VSYFFGGLFLANAMPHLVGGQMLISIYIAGRFGRFHGGNDPK